MKLITLLLISLQLFAYPQISESIKEKQLYPMGKKIHTKKCPSLTKDSYQTYDALLLDIEQRSICGTLSKKHSEALALYLWDKEKAHSTHYKKITVTKDEKCQVCGMYLHYYPTWVSQINYPNAESYKFDGIKDMMKFYFNNEEGIVDILVQDYYTLETINAREAYYVTGSDVLGPMGNELIAFKDAKSAKTFLLEHNGKHLYRFDALSEKMVRALD